MLKLKVTGITCSGCVNSIRKAVGSLADKAMIDVDIAKGEVTITNGPDKSIAIKAIEEAGYDVVGEAA